MGFRSSNVRAREHTARPATSCALLPWPWPAGCPCIPWPGLLAVLACPGLACWLSLHALAWPAGCHCMSWPGLLAIMLGTLGCTTTFEAVAAHKAVAVHDTGCSGAPEPSPALLGDRSRRTPHVSALGRTQRSCLVTWRTTCARLAGSMAPPQAGRGG